jgi:quinol monooxygenase YgiN
MLLRRSIELVIAEPGVSRKLRGSPALAAVAGIALSIVGPVISSGGSASGGTEPARILTFVEVRQDAVERGRRMLADYALALRRGSEAADAVVLQELDRPDRFALVESAGHAGSLSAAEDRARTALLRLEVLLVAPLDRREHRDFLPGCARASGGVSLPRARLHPGDGEHILYVLTHVDIAGRPGSVPDSAFRELAQAGCAASGNLAFHVWQQSNRGNHFNLVAAWAGRSDWASFVSGAAARRFRESVGPMLGSLYDERLYRVVE